MYYTIFRAVIQAFLIKTIDKSNFPIYNKDRKRQDLKRLCQNVYFVKNNTTLAGRVIFLWRLLKVTEWS